MTFLRLSVLILATFRLTILLTKDKGPGWVILKLRSLVARKTPKKAHLDELVVCPWCSSVWFGIAVACGEFSYLKGNLFYEVALLALALSGGAIILNQTFTRDK